MPLPPEEMAALTRLEQRLNLLVGDQLGRLQERDLEEMVTLYRFASGALVRVRDAGDDPALERRINGAVSRGYAAIYAKRGHGFLGIFALALREFPRQVRAHGGSIGLAAAAFLGPAAAAFATVWISPELAYSLFNPAMVAMTDHQLQTQTVFQGNFTFGSSAAGPFGVFIAANNIYIAIFAFVGGALILPSLFSLAYNGIMVGVLFGLAAARGRFWDMANLLMCHGTLELTAIVLAGGAGLTVGTAWIAPGRLSRKRAVSEAGRDAAVLALGTALTLAVAAMIEAFITPFAAPEVRTLVAISSGILYALLLTSAGRRKAPEKQPL
ncbi:MAG: stage II sporulation protein M [Planctomycetes bacterium]|nr:stage II sporulation protein M [Planctomycetota bacterium]